MNSLQKYKWPLNSSLHTFGLFEKLGGYIYNLHLDETEPNISNTFMHHSVSWVLIKIRLHLSKSGFIKLILINWMCQLVFVKGINTICICHCTAYTRSFLLQNLRYCQASTGATKIVLYYFISTRPSLSLCSNILHRKSIWKRGEACCATQKLRKKI